MVAIEKAGGSAEALAMDLCSMQSIRDGAAKVRGKHDKLHVLINNAGLWARRREVTTDGFETMWAVNVLAPILLAQELLAPLKLAGKARVVNVASGYHLLGKIKWDDLQREKGFRYRKVYAQSKLAIIMLTNEMSRRHADIDVTFKQCSPGYDCVTVVPSMAKDSALGNRHGHCATQKRAQPRRSCWLQAMSSRKPRASTSTDSRWLTPKSPPATRNSAASYSTSSKSSSMHNLNQRRQVTRGVSETSENWG